MNQFKYGLSIIVPGLMLLSSAAYADSWSCKNGNMLREVKVSYSGDGPVPCSVVYNKPDEGATSQVLWNAESEQGFCEEKAQGFVSKLESWGWVCSNDDATAPAEPAAAMPEPAQPADDAEPAQPADAGMPEN
jgi:hypothetical protein